MRSVMCAPLMYEEEVLGFILLDTQRIASNYDKEGLQLLVGIANQAALSIANARLHRRLVQRERLEQDLRNARRIQNSFLPTEPPQIEGYQFVDWYGTALEVGGDFYDFIELPDRQVLVVVGDVSGKGISAALMMAQMASNVRFFAGSRAGPSGLLQKLNDVALSPANDMFVTVLVMYVDCNENVVHLSNAGHCYPMRRKPNGQVERIEGANGFPVGITEEAEFPEITVELGDGEIITAFSDGIIEAMNEDGELFGYRKLSATMAESADNPADVVKGIQKAMRDHTGAAAQSDDLTLVCFGRTE
jgi:serine phosphatase RsbU (regulator of sigma subunit)